MAQLMNPQLTADEEPDPAGLLDEVLEALALRHEVGRVPVQHMGVRGVDVDVLEELVPHVVVVRLGVVARQSWTERDRLMNHHD